MNLITVCPTLVLGPMLQCTTNASSLVLVKLLKGICSFHTLISSSSILRKSTTFVEFYYYYMTFFCDDLLVLNFKDLLGRMSKFVLCKHKFLRNVGFDLAYLWGEPGLLFTLLRIWKIENYGKSHKIISNLFEDRGSHIFWFFSLYRCMWSMCI